ncbi:peroxidase [Musa troglodytarum]|uniref:Peroxidase n=1 Tax=Musa troglodytarum TaxID=320322 RepID=A0A9E7GJ90_9LILI|nr:peroxidase [Musa troglodytarum]
MAATSGFAAVLAIASLLCLTIAPTRGALQVGFYKGKCNRTDVEGTVKSIVAARFARDRTIVPALLRLHFHDCFVRGCDASILIDGSGTEKTAPPNLSVRGYDLIDQAKTQLERACPGVVSCADIIAIATRDAVVLVRKGFSVDLQTGRRDGNISLASDASKNLPGASLNASQAIAAFRAKGLSASYTVLLLGAHTVGITHCSFIRNRLYNYNDMDPAFVAMLRKRCPQTSAVDNSVFLDNGTPSTVDNSYYKQLLAKRGVLKVDQNLAMDAATNGTVKSLASGSLSFPSLFGNAMVKMGSIQVLTGAQGQIRKSCRAVNK